MAIPSPQQAADKLRTRIQQSGTAYQAGVNAVTENPAAKAIAAKDKWEQGIQDAIANNRYVKGLENVTLQSWKAQTLNYGVTRFTQSADKAGQNYQKFAERFFPFLEQTMQTINAMPDTTFEERIQKMIANARALRDFRNT